MPNNDTIRGFLMGCMLTFMGFATTLPLFGGQPNAPNTPSGTPQAPPPNKVQQASAPPQIALPYKVQHMVDALKARGEMKTVHAFYAYKASNAWFYVVLVAFIGMLIYPAGLLLQVLPQGWVGMRFRETLALYCPSGFKQRPVRCTMLALLLALILPLLYQPMLGQGGIALTDRGLLVMKGGRMQQGEWIPYQDLVRLVNFGNGMEISFRRHFTFGYFNHLIRPLALKRVRLRAASFQGKAYFRHFVQQLSAYLKHTMTDMMLKKMAKDNQKAIKQALKAYKEGTLPEEKDISVSLPRPLQRWLKKWLLAHPLAFSRVIDYHPFKPMSFKNAAIFWLLCAIVLMFGKEFNKHPPNLFNREIFNKEFATYMYVISIAIGLGLMLTALLTTIFWLGTCRNGGYLLTDTGLLIRGYYNSVSSPVFVPYKEIQAVFLHPFNMDLAFIIRKYKPKIALYPSKMYGHEAFPYFVKALQAAIARQHVRDGTFEEELKKTSL